MTYSYAKLIVWNPDAYDAKTVADAAVFILSRLSASKEDVHAATYALADVTLAKTA